MVHETTNIQGGTWAVCRFKRRLGKKDGSGFLRGIVPVGIVVSTVSKHLS